MDIYGKILLQEFSTILSAFLLYLFIVCSALVFFFLDLDANSNSICFNLLRTMRNLSFWHSFLTVKTFTQFSSIFYAVFFNRPDSILNCIFPNFIVFLIEIFGIVVHHSHSIIHTLSNPLWEWISFLLGSNLEIQSKYEKGDIKS